MNATPYHHVLVLLDPGAPEGEQGLATADELVAAGGHLTLAVAISGPEAWALEDLARSEGVSVAAAAEIFLERACARSRTAQLSTTSLLGYDLFAELTVLVSELALSAMVVPGPMAVRALTTKRHWARLPVPVVLVPRMPVPAA